MSHEYAFTLPRWASIRSNESESQVSGLTSALGGGGAGIGSDDLLLLGNNGSGRNVGVTSTRSILDERSITGSDTCTTHNDADQMLLMGEEDDIELYLLRARNRLCRLCTSRHFLFKCTFVTAVLCFIVGVSTFKWANNKSNDFDEVFNSNNSQQEEAAALLSYDHLTERPTKLQPPPFDLMEKCSYDSIHDTPEQLAACEMNCAEATRCCLQADCYQTNMQICDDYYKSCQTIYVNGEVYGSADETSSPMTNEEMATMMQGEANGDDVSSSQVMNVQDHFPWDAEAEHELLETLNEACFHQQDLSDCTNLCEVGRCCFLKTCSSDEVNCEHYHEPCSVLGEFDPVYQSMDRFDENMKQADSKATEEEEEGEAPVEEEEEKDVSEESLYYDSAMTTTTTSTTLEAAEEEDSNHNNITIDMPDNLDDICSLEDLSECMELCDVVRCCFEPSIDCSSDITEDICNHYRPCSVLDIYDDEWELIHIGAHAGV